MPEGILAAMMREGRWKIQQMSSRALLLPIVLIAAAAAGCAAVPPHKPATPPPAEVAAPPAEAAPAPEPRPAAATTAIPEPAPPPATPPPAIAAPAAKSPAVKPPAAKSAAPFAFPREGTYRAAPWAELPGWRDDNVAEAWGALITSCGAIGNRDAWREACAAAARLATPNTDAARRYFERHFTPYRVGDATSGEEGLITGYYEPLLRGSRKPDSRYRFPVFGVPDDLLVVELTDVHPELKGMRLRGRIEGRRIVPYYDRAQIESGRAAVQGREIVWVDDAVALFFLHVQGSGRVLLESGETLRLGYADHNGHPYRSIGRVLIERGELTLEQASMQGIQAWVQQNPGRMKELLNANASYVFFRELPAEGSGPIGALGVPLTTRRSVAIDPRFVPLGAPVFLATTWPNTARPLNRLMLAQDTGSAIRGAARADFFWGFGEAAGREAGRMRQRVRMWVLLPNGHPVPAAPAR